jgi:hypothetical protein
MPVYADRARNPYRGMLMRHLLADSLDELHAMADALGLRRAWFQGHVSTPHYDICQAKRGIAIRLGAIRNRSPADCVADPKASCGDLDP